jgi:hypothetical protein
MPPQDEQRCALGVLLTDVREPQKVERVGPRKNSIKRVFSGCSSKRNLASLWRRASVNRTASARFSNPTMKSSAYRTTITSPAACVFLHHEIHRSRT